MRHAILTLTTLLMACEGNTVAFPGIESKLMFPFDGEREWLFRSTDMTIPYQLQGELLDAVEVIDGKNVYTINYFRDCRQPNCDDGLEFALRLSNTSPEGVFIHGFDDGRGNQDISPAIHVSERQIRVGDILETTTIGVDFEAEYIGGVDCSEHILIQADWDCHEFQIRSTPALYPLTGAIRVVPSQGIVNFEFEGQNGAWQVLSSTQTGADGIW